MHKYGNYGRVGTIRGHHTLNSRGGARYLSDKFDDMYVKPLTRLMMFDLHSLVSLFEQVASQISIVSDQCL
jgi:hypothetical protein